MRRTRTAKLLVHRHSALVRATHWINVAALAVLLMSGLQIFNAHPALYWGQKAVFARPWLSIGPGARDGELIGVVRMGDRALETTGVLGLSGPPQARQVRAFPAWATLPGPRSLADGRRWHFFFAWLFALNGLVYWAHGLAGGHVRRDLLPRRDQITPRHLWREVVDHARLRFPKGEEARSYNALQKIAYLGTAAVLLPLMVGTGLTMSPAMNAAWPWLVDLFGGRQSARTLHFLSAGLIVLFVLAHLAMVAASGVWNNLRSMITGRYAIDPGAEA